MDIFVRMLPTVGFLIGALAYYAWKHNRFCGIFWRKLFHEGMSIEFWYKKDNGYGVYLKHLESEYQILTVDLKEKTLLLRRNDNNSGVRFLVSFAWLFEQVARPDNYMLLKDKENNYVRKFR